MEPDPTVSVVLPAYGLGSVIADNARRVVAACAELRPQVIVVDDGSEDDTFERASELAATMPQVTVVRHPRNLGKGQALVSGWKEAVAPRVVFIDGDLDLPPEQVPSMVAMLDTYDVVVGAKQTHMAEGGYPWSRRVMSRLYSSATSGMFGLPVSETQTGLKAFRKEVLDAILPHVELGGWAFDLELLARIHRAGYSMTETPVDVSVSERGAPVRMSMMWALARDSATLAWRLRR